MNLWNEIWFVAIWTFNIGFAAVDAYITFGIIGFTTMQPCFSSVLFTKLATYFLKTISTTWNNFDIIWFNFKKTCITKIIIKTSYSLMINHTHCTVEYVVLIIMIWKKCFWRSWYSVGENASVVIYTPPKLIAVVPISTYT